MQTFKQTLQLFPAALLLTALFVLSGCAMSRTAPVQELSVTVDDNGYAPTALAATSGTMIKLTLNNVGTQEHQFAIDQIALEMSGGSGNAMAGMDMPGMDMGGDDVDMPQVHIVAAAGAATTLEFIPVQSGEYEYTCILPDHGERGVLTVKSS